MKKITGFTLMEILTAIIIVGILSSLSLVSYQKVMDTNNDRICKQNQAVLQAAVEIYTLEGNSLPITLGMLTDRQIHLAYEKVVGNKENKFLAFLNDALGVKPAIAAFNQTYYGDRKVLHCPADKTGQEISYAVNANINSPDKLITLSAQALFYDNAAFHPKGIIITKYANGISPIGITDEIINDSGTMKIKKVKEFVTAFAGTQDLERNTIQQIADGTIGATAEQKEIAKQTLRKWQEYKISDNVKIIKEIYDSNLNNKTCATNKVSCTVTTYGYASDFALKGTPFTKKSACRKACEDLCDNCSYIKEKYRSYCKYSCQVAMNCEALGDD